MLFCCIEALWWYIDRVFLTEWAEFHQELFNFTNARTKPSSIFYCDIRQCNKRCLGKFKSPITATTIHKSKINNCHWFAVIEGKPTCFVDTSNNRSWIDWIRALYSGTGHCNVVNIHKADKRKDNPCIHNVFSFFKNKSDIVITKVLKTITNVMWEYVTLVVIPWARTIWRC